MNKLTLYEFNQLPDQEQYNIVFNYGTFIMHYFENYRKFSLYAVDQFFVEVEYCSNENRIVGKNSFKTGKELLKYSPINIRNI